MAKKAKIIELEEEIILIDDLPTLDRDYSALGELLQDEEFVHWKAKAKEGIYDVSASKLSAIRKSPVQFVKYLFKKNNEEKISNALIEGKSGHALLFEPETFFLRYLVLPKPTKLNKNESTETHIGKIDYIKYVALAKSKGIKEENILDKDTYRDILLKKELFYSEPTTRAILEEEGICEQEFRFTYIYKGKSFNFHGFKDKYLKKNNGIVELKNIQNIRFWEREIFDLGYITQVAIYLLDNFIKDGNFDIFDEIDYDAIIQKVINEGVCYFLICNNDGVLPAIKLKPETIEKGFIQLHETLDKLVKCTDYTDWSKSYSYNMKLENDCIKF